MIEPIARAARKPARIRRWHRAGAAIALTVVVLGLDVGSAQALKVTMHDFLITA